MSLQDWTNLVAAAAILVCGFNVIVLQRVVMRQGDQIRRLTRRVWILEGSPTCDRQNEQVSA